MSLLNKLSLKKMLEQLKKDGECLCCKVIGPGTFGYRHWREPKLDEEKLKESLGEVQSEIWTELYFNSEERFYGKRI